MTWIVLQLAFPMVFLGTALYLYRSGRALLVGFREQLAVSAKGRRFVVLMGVLILLVYHFIALCGMSDSLDLLTSSVLMFVLFSQRYGEAAIRLFQGKGFGFFAFVVALGAFFHVATVSWGVTFMVLLVVSWIYPTRALEREMAGRGDTHDIIGETVDGLGRMMAEGHMDAVVTEKGEDRTEDGVVIGTVVPAEDVDSGAEGRSCVSGNCSEGVAHK